ncbi:hypothetical protein [Actinoplanes sp. NPDC049118]|uniref:hypothetical protein n=1 Tax=Actinoplanes sp. NPDC049118 TaxID=3155769 RepID=UPI0033FB85AF
MQLTALRCVIGGMFVFSLTALSGCVGFVAESSDIDLTQTCALTALEAASPAVHDPQVTTAHHVVMKSGQIESDVKLSNSPENAHVTWTAMKVGKVDDVLRLLPPKVKQALSTNASPGSEQVAAFKSKQGLKDGTFIAYAAIRPVTVEFTGNCADGDPTSGTLIAWTDPDIGVVRCESAPSAEASAGGRNAQAEYC